MRKIMLLIGVLIGMAASSQVKQTYSQYGGLWNRLALKDSGAFQLPKKIMGIKDFNTGLDTAQIRYDPSDSTVKVYTGYQWRSASGGVVTASNGLTVASNNVKWGGTLVDGNTTINVNSNNVNFTNVRAMSFTGTNAIYGFDLSSTVGSFRLSNLSNGQIQGNVGAEYLLGVKDTVNGDVAYLKLGSGLNVSATPGTLNVSTLNQNTTGSAATLTTARDLYGFSFNGSAGTVSGTNIIGSSYGGSGNGFFKVSGPASTEKTMTFPNANATIARTDAGQTFIGANIFSSDLTVNGLTVGLGAGSNSFNTVLGYIALASNTSGSSNVAVGYWSMLNNTSGGNNTAIGTFALGSNTTSSSSTAVGYSAGNHSTATGNTFIGAGSGQATTSGGLNTSIGYNSMLYNTTGDQNTAVGINALLHNTTAQKNTGVGAGVMEDITTGSLNTAIGQDAVLNITTGIGNNGVGWNSLSAMTTGLYNQAVGYLAGGRITTGSYNDFFGRDAGQNASQKVDAVSSMALGFNSYTTLDSTIALGGSHIKGVGIGSTSYAPDASALLDISSTTKGVKLPTLTAAQMLAISSPVSGLIIYNSDSSAYCFYNGSAWLKISQVTASSTSTLTNKRITARYGSTASSATPTINTDNVDTYELTALAVDITSFTTNLSGTPTIDQPLHIIIVGTAARAITWGASFEASTVPLPTTTVSTNRLDAFFIWNATTSKWRCSGSW